MRRAGAPGAALAAAWLLAGCPGGGGDAGGTADGGEAGLDAAGGGSDAAGTDAAAPSDGGTACVQATLLWFEDFETGAYGRWTSTDYGNDWNGGLCHGNGFSTDQAVSPVSAHRSEITCAIGESHRGYGGMSV